MKTIINIIASAALVIAPISAMASAGWAFDNPNVTEVTKGSASAQKGSYDAGWAFNNPNVSEVRKGAESAENHYKKHKNSSGVGWAFDHPHEPMEYGHSNS